MIFFSVDDYFVVIIVTNILHMKRAHITELFALVVVHTRELVHSQHRNHLL
jgi:hypothetical protein